MKNNYLLVPLQNSNSFAMIDYWNEDLLAYTLTGTRTGTEYNYPRFNTGPYARETLHRVVAHRATGIVTNKDYVDHINHNVLDCRESNLRVCTPTDNKLNNKQDKELYEYLRMPDGLYQVCVLADKFAEKEFDSYMEYKDIFMQSVEDNMGYFIRNGVATLLYRI